MHSKFRLAAKYFRYYLKASNGSGHGIHSPFVYDFVRAVLMEQAPQPVFQEIEKLRSYLLQDHHSVPIKDFGAGSNLAKTNTRRIKDITRWTSKSPKQGRMLYRLVNHYRPRTILELGTSVGISAAYLSSGNLSAEMISLEGAGSVAGLAEKNLASLHLANVKVMVGEFDQTIEMAIQALGCKKGESGLDMAFVDGNHRLEPTCRYFDLLANTMSPVSVIVLDDIHWSLEMEEAWANIQKDCRTLLSIDLFFIGIVFFRPDFRSAQHFTIRF